MAKLIKYLVGGSAAVGMIMGYAGAFKKMEIEKDVKFPYEKVLYK